MSKKLLKVSLWMVLLIGAAGCSSVSQQPTAQPTNTINPDVVSSVPTASFSDAAFPAPDFTLTALDGTTYTLSQLRGTPVIINFWATWCGPCRAEMPDLQEIAARYEEKLILLGINQNESAEQVQAYVDEIGVTFPILMNPTDAVLADYTVMGLPQTLVVNPQGMVIYRAFGAIDFAQFTPIVENLMAASAA